MHNHENNPEELDLFKDEYTRDPFREEPNLVYKTNPGGYFQIHIDHSSPQNHKEEEHKKEHGQNAQTSELKQSEKKQTHTDHQQTNHRSHIKKENNSHNSEGPRNFKEIIRNAARQIIASVVIFFLGIVLLNWQAYSQIAVSRIHKIIGVERESKLVEIVEESDDNQETSENLQTSIDPDVQKKLIPELNLEVAPTDNRIIVPRIDQNIPIVRVSSQNLIARDWNALEIEMQDALQDGVVHYPGTSLPGQNGNVVITGHSSYFPWDAGRFKDVFALLHDIVEGDKLVIFYEQDKYIYEVTGSEVVLPEDIDVLKQTPDDRLTLITCTPVGTNLKRLIVYAKPIMKNGVSLLEDTQNASSQGITR